MTTPTPEQATDSTRGESKAQMELNDAFRLKDKDVLFMELAKCHFGDGIKWFADAGERGAVSKAIKFCSDCPVRKRCLEYSLNNEISYGVWGGVSAYKRRNMLHSAKYLIKLEHEQKGTL